MSEPDEEANNLVNFLLSADESSLKDTTRNDDNNALKINKTPCSEVSFYINETLWSSVSWQLEVARRILNYSTYSLAVFDVVYVSMVIFEIVVNFDRLSSMHKNAGVPFTVFFVVFSVFNAFAPPLGLHLIKSILLHPSIPKVFQEATKYDTKFHFRMHCLAHFNCASSLLAVLLSFFTNPLYRFIQLPFLVLYVVPLSFTLSVVVCLLEGHRLLACQFIQSLQDGSLSHQSNPSRDIVHASPSAEQDYLSDEGCALLDNRGTALNAVDFYGIRNQYYDLHVRFDNVRQQWGLKLLFIVVSLLLFTVGLVWYSYISEFNGVKFALVLPYIIMSLFSLCEIMFALTLVNELGAKVSKTLAKFIFKYGQSPNNGKESSIITDINNLLILSQIVPIEIPFVEGFSLRVRLTAILVGPLIGSIVPKLLEQ